MSPTDRTYVNTVPVEHVRTLGNFSHNWPWQVYLAELVSVRLSERTISKTQVDKNTKLGK